MGQSSKARFLVGSDYTGWRTRHYLEGVRPSPLSSYSRANACDSVYRRCICHREGDRTNTRLYQNCRMTRVVLSPAAVGAQKIGHFGFFRSRFPDSLWVRIADWLRADMLT